MARLLSARYAGAFTQPLRLQSSPSIGKLFVSSWSRFGISPTKYVCTGSGLDPRRLKGAGGSRHLLPCQIDHIEKWELKPLVYALAPHHQYSSYAFDFTASRNVQHYILKVILPLILIVIMSWSVFWMIRSIRTPDQYRRDFDAYSDCLPFCCGYSAARLPYMTRLDAFILTSHCSFLSSSKF